MILVLGILVACCPDYETHGDQLVVQVEECLAIYKKHALMYLIGINVC